MSLLRDLLKEEAAAGATAAHAVAGGGGHETTADYNQSKKSKKKKKGKTLLRKLKESETDFDTADVVSKLKSAEKSAELDKDTQAFALEDENGQLVKVYVRSDQAEDFEKALEAMLTQEDDDSDQENSALEIAEVLFKLKDQFDIVDVEWPEIPEDEEEPMDVEGGEGEDMGLDAEGGEGEDLEGEDMGDDMEMTADEDMGGDETEAASALQAVIDMMKADAEARKAEAEAKKAEAETKTAQAAADKAAAKVKQEEELLDMEAYNKQKSEEDKEAKRLAQLAKYKHDLASDEASEEFAAPEEEEVEGTRMVSLKDLTKFLSDRLRAQ